MDDLEMTRLCADAVGLEYFVMDSNVGPVVRLSPWETYDPLRNDAHAMALVKKFTLLIHPFEPPIADRGTWWVACDEANAEGMDLNCCIVECVAKMQAAKSGQAAALTG